MPVGRDLGFPNLVVLVVVFVIVPAIAFVIRRKWLQAEARREEIKRLLILASEEATRAEIDGYFYRTSSPDSSWAPVPESVWIPPTTPAPPLLKPTYQCAVCFSPTSTRCAKCKAVRYCSGRCQIVHWRQGHKDECRPYVAVNPIKDDPINSSNQVDGKDENFHEGLHHKDDDEPEKAPIFQSTSESSYEAKNPSTEPSPDSSGECDNFMTVKSGARKATGSVKNQSKSNLSDEDTQSRFSSSSSRADGGSSFSEPSTTSSGFWSGVIHSNKSSIDGFESSDSFESTKSGYNISTMKGVSVNSNNKSNREEATRHRDKVNVSPSGVQGEDHRTINNSKPFNGMPFSAIPERSNHVFNNGVSLLSKTCDTHLTSSSSRLVKSVMINDEKIRVSTCTPKMMENSESGRNGFKTSMLKVVDQLKPSKSSRNCSQRTESETTHGYSCKGLFLYEAFVKLYNWKKVELQPFGLINCGNSCYANVVLQCLTYTPSLNAYLLQGLHSKTCDKRGWCFACEFEGLVLKAKDGNSTLSPIRILSQIGNIGSNLGHGREEDAHEFLRYAIDNLQSVCSKESGTNASNLLEEETNLIRLTFGGYLRSKIKCMKCGGKSERHERMMDLTVEIEGDIATLEEALDKFTCTEILDGENKYKCSRCKSYERAKKKLTLLEAPNVLTIALKRFQSGKFGKLNKPIHYPEILDMAPYVSGTSDKSPIYRLYGVVVHVDIMNAAFSGHYVCYVKNVENRWFKIDDSRVKEVDLLSVLTKGAYMLLYARCSPRAPRVIRNLLMRHHHDQKKHKTFTSEPWVPTIRHRSLEEESSSSDSSSGIFSESCSCSTESSIEDHILWDWEHESPWRNSSDSDTSSSSSSSFPSPLYTRHSLVYQRGVEDDQCSCSNNTNSCCSRDRLGVETSKPSLTLRRSSTRRK